MVDESSVFTNAQIWETMMWLQKTKQFRICWFRKEWCTFYFWKIRFSVSTKGMEPANILVLLTMMRHLLKKRCLPTRKEKIPKKAHYRFFNQIPSVSFGNANDGSVSIYDVPQDPANSWHCIVFIILKVFISRTNFFSEYLHCCMIINVAASNSTISIIASQKEKLYLDTLDRKQSETQQYQLSLQVCKAKKKDKCWKMSPVTLKNNSRLRPPVSFL